VRVNDGQLLGVPLCQRPPPARRGAELASAWPSFRSENLLTLLASQAHRTGLPAQPEEQQVQRRRAEARAHARHALICRLARQGVAVFQLLGLRHNGLHLHTPRVRSRCKPARASAPKNNIARTGCRPAGTAPGCARPRCAVSCHPFAGQPACEVRRAPARLCSGEAERPRRGRAGSASPLHCR